MGFSDVISQLNSKIQASADGATAEELAYLSAAAEKIGGQASLLDIEKFSKEEMAAILVAVTYSKEEALAEIEALRLTASGLISSLRESAENEIASANVVATDAINTTAQDAVSETTLAIDSAVSTLDSATSNSLQSIVDAADQALVSIAGSRVRAVFLSQS